jgi:hypothetical protein
MLLPALRFAVAMALAVLAGKPGSPGSALWVGLLAVVGSGFVTDALVTRPAASRWLREHAHELDRYVAPR